MPFTFYDPAKVLGGFSRTSILIKVPLARSKFSYFWRSLSDRAFSSSSSTPASPSIYPIYGLLIPTPLLLPFFLADWFLCEDFFFCLVLEAKGFINGVVSTFFSSIIRSLVPLNSPFSKFWNSCDEGTLVFCPSPSTHSFPSSSELSSCYAGLL